MAIAAALEMKMQKKPKYWTWMKMEKAGYQVRRLHEDSMGQKQMPNNMESFHIVAYKQKMARPLRSKPKKDEVAAKEQSVQDDAKEVEAVKESPEARSVEDEKTVVHRKTHVTPQKLPMAKLMSPKHPVDATAVVCAPMFYNDSFSGSRGVHLRF